MASNKELREEIATLAAALGEEHDTERMGNPSLVSLLDELRGRATAPAPAAEPAEDPAPPPVAAVDGTEGPAVGGAPPPASPPPPPQRHRYQVAAGKALTSPRGVLGPGEEILPRDFSGGTEQLEQLVAKGYVTKS